MHRYIPVVLLSNQRTKSMRDPPLRHQIRQPTGDNYGLVTTWKCQGALPVKSAIFMPCDFWQSSYGWRMEHASGDPDPASMKPAWMQ